MALKALLNRLRRSPAAVQAAPPTPRYDPLDPVFVRDPYPLYGHLRDADPVHQTAAGAVMLTRYADVVEALGNPLLGNAPASYAAVAPRHREHHVSADLANNILPFLDDPEHAPLRRVMARTFHAQQKTHPLDLAAMAARHAATVTGRAEFDVIADFATPFALDAACALLGIPVAEGAELKRLSEQFFYLFSRIPSEAARAEIDRSLAQFRDYAQSLVAARRAAPGTDYLSALIAGAVEAGIDEAAVRDAVILIFADAIENVDRAVATCLHLLLTHPDQLDRLRRDQGLLPGAIEECLRFEAPAQAIARVAREALTLHGVAVRKDQAVLLALGAANRDERRFEEPDRFDIARSDNPHLSFGKGRHSCIGGSLAARQIEAALTVLLALPGLALADSTPRWLARPGHRWLGELRVTLGETGGDRA